MIRIVRDHQSGTSAAFAFGFFTVRKRSCGKVMFLHLSVILFGGCVFQHAPQATWPGGLCSEGDLCIGGSVQLCSRDVSVQGGLCLRGGLSRENLCQGEPPHMVTSGRYASHWKAFLFLMWIELRAYSHWAKATLLTNGVLPISTVNLPHTRFQVRVPSILKKVSGSR